MAFDTEAAVLEVKKVRLLGIPNGQEECILISSNVTLGSWVISEQHNKAIHRVDLTQHGCTASVSLSVCRTKSPPSSISLGQLVNILK